MLKKGLLLLLMLGSLSILCAQNNYRISEINYSKYHRNDEIEYAYKESFYYDDNGVLFNKKKVGTQSFKVGKTYVDDKYVTKGKKVTVFDMEGKKKKKFIYDKNTNNLVYYMPSSAIDYDFTYSQSGKLESFGRHLHVSRNAIAKNFANLTHKCIYNSAGKLIEIEVYYKDGSKTDSYMFKYNNARQLIEVSKKKGETLNIYKLSYKAGKIDKISFYESKENNLFFEIKYTYDEFGRVIKEDRYSMNYRLSKMELAASSQIKYEDKMTKSNNIFDVADLWMYILFGQRSYSSIGLFEGL